MLIEPHVAVAEAGDRRDDLRHRWSASRWAFSPRCKPGSLIDTATMVGAVSGLSLSQFWLGLLLMYLFALKLEWLPSFGYGDGGLRNLILPAIALGVSADGAAGAHHARGRAGRAERRFRPHRAQQGHERAPRRELARAAQRAGAGHDHVGLQFGSLMGQAVVIEKLFAWPGVGSLLVDSVFQRDMPAVQGCILMIVLFFLVINTLVDHRLCRDRPAHRTDEPIDEHGLKLRSAQCRRLALGRRRLVAIAIAAAILAPWIALTDPVMDANLMNAEMPPGWEFPFGTDAQGRDIYSRIVYGARISLTVGIVSQIINTLIGVTLGLTAGYWGGWWDDLVNGLTNLMLAIPSLVFALAIMAMLGPGLVSLLIALGLTNWS